MKVRDLIKELKNKPPGAEVYWRDHDQGEGEVNCSVDYVKEWDETDVESHEWGYQPKIGDVILTP